MHAPCIPAATGATKWHQNVVDLRLVNCFCKTARSTCTCESGSADERLAAVCRFTPMGDRFWGRIMHKLKYLLAGTAGLLAVSSAQAAPPVQYVRICSLYGDGFYYIPGTDTCIRFGGMIQSDYAFNVGLAHTPQYFGGAGAQDRSVSSYSSRHRLEFNLDTRTGTQYGTLRTYSSFYAQNEL